MTKPEAGTMRTLKSFRRAARYIHAVFIATLVALALACDDDGGADPSGVHDAGERDAALGRDAGVVPHDAGDDGPDSGGPRCTLDGPNPGCPCDLPPDTYCCGDNVQIACTPAGVWGAWILDAGTCEPEVDDAGVPLVDHCV